MATDCVSLSARIIADHRKVFPHSASAVFFLSPQPDDWETYKVQFVERSGLASVEIPVPVNPRGARVNVAFPPAAWESLSPDERRCGSLSYKRCFLCGENDTRIGGDDASCKLTRYWYCKKHWTNCNCSRCWGGANDWSD